MAVGAPRLRRAGIDVPGHPFQPAEHRLYQLRTLSDAARIHAFMEAVGQAARKELRLYFTEGATAVLNGWRATTIDVDILMMPEDDRVFREIPKLKERLEINVELASPANFIPEIPGWQERSAFIERRGKVSVHHHDLYAQALAKIERGHAQDGTDVEEMIRRGLVDRGRLLNYFELIEPRLYRYPAIDPVTFRRAVERACAPEAGIGPR